MDLAKSPFSIHLKRLLLPQPLVSQSRQSAYTNTCFTALESIGDAAVDVSPSLPVGFPEVNRVVGFDISEEDVATASENARLNRVEAKTKFMRSNSFEPFSDTDRRELESLKGKVNFILANPPSSENDDGFEYRRIVLRGAREFLVKRRLCVPQHLLSIRHIADNQFGERRPGIPSRRHSGDHGLCPI